MRGLYNACNGYALYSCCVQLKCTIQAWIVLLIVLTLKIHNIVVKLNAMYKKKVGDLEKKLTTFDQYALEDGENMISYLKLAD